MIYIADDAAPIKITGAQAAQAAGDGEESVEENE
jgi:hypothetical protein